MQALLQRFLLKLLRQSGAVPFLSRAQRFPKDEQEAAKHFEQTESELSLLR